MGPGELYIQSAGNLTTTVVPPSRWLSTAIVPPFNSMLRLAIGNPSPVPVVFVEKYGSNALASASPSMPAPVSLT